MEITAQVFIDRVKSFICFTQIKIFKLYCNKYFVRMAQRWSFDGNEGIEVSFKELKNRACSDDYERRSRDTWEKQGAFG